MPTISDILHQIKFPHSPTATLDLELLLAHVLGKSRSFLYTFGDFKLNYAQNTHLQQLIKRRQQGEPIAYIVGYQGFWNLDLKVNCHTLIPRPETELIVEQALQLLDENLTAQILDLGTGSGAIALALAKNRPKWQVLATDLSYEALNCAKQNAKQLHINNLQFKLSNWFTNLKQQKFNLIVSNPPYIDKEDVHLKQGDVRFEPQPALIAANQGLADLAHIVDKSAQFLAPQGYLILEHGFSQAPNVRQFLVAKNFNKITTIKDLAGLERVTCGQLI